MRAMRWLLACFTLLCAASLIEGKKRHNKLYDPPKHRHKARFNDFGNEPREAPDGTKIPREWYDDPVRCA